MIEYSLINIIGLLAIYDTFTLVVGTKPISATLRSVPAANACATPICIRCIGGHVTTSIQTMLNSSDSRDRELVLIFSLLFRA
jgi:hypothetical protein